MSPSNRQTPAADEIYLDHVAWFVSDMSAAVALRADELGVTRQFLTSHGWDPCDDGGWFRIDPGPAMGSTLLFHEPGDNWPPDPV